MYYQLQSNKRNKHHKLPLSRSASLSEVDIIGNDEQFIDIEDVLNAHQPHIEKNNEDRTVLNKR